MRNAAISTVKASRRTSRHLANLWRDIVQRDYAIDVNPILADARYPAVTFVTTDTTTAETIIVGGGKITDRALRYSLRLERLLRTTRSRRRRRRHRPAHSLRPDREGADRGPRRSCPTDRL